MKINFEKLSFEEAMNMLEDSVKRLENGNMSLDDSIGEFEKAMKLAAICNKRLETAEHKVRILTESEDGSISDAPFDVRNEA
jgi:exodeoxyribonuclease VII small subunit